MLSTACPADSAHLLTRGRLAPVSWCRLTGSSPPSPRRFRANTRSGRSRCSSFPPSAVVDYVDCHRRSPKMKRQAHLWIPGRPGGRSGPRPPGMLLDGRSEPLFCSFLFACVRPAGAPVESLATASHWHVARDGIDESVKRRFYSSFLDCSSFLILRRRQPRSPLRAPDQPFPTSEARFALRRGGLGRAVPSPSTR